MAKLAWQFWFIFLGESKVRKIFVREVFIRGVPTTLLQIFCKIIVDSKVIAKNVPGPVDNA